MGAERGEAVKHAAGRPGGAEEAVLHGEAGGAETEAGFEEGEIRGQGRDVCEV